MRISLFVVINFVLCCRCLAVDLGPNDLVGKATELEDRIDQRQKHIALLFDYSNRLQKILSHAGYPGDDLLGPRTLEQRLERSIVMPRLTNARVADAIATWSRVSKIDAIIDWNSLKQAGFSNEIRASVDPQNVSGGNALNIIIDAFGRETPLARRIDEGRLIITALHSGVPDVMTRGFNVSNIQFQRHELAAMVMDTVAPDTWQDAGGTVGLLAFDGDRMIVTQTRENLAAVDNLLEQIDPKRRLARAHRLIEQQQMKVIDLDIEIGKLTARCRSLGIRPPPRLDEALPAVLPDLIFRATPLWKCVRALETASGQEIGVDWRALEEAGIDRDAPITVSLRHRTLERAIQDFVKSIADYKVDYAIDENTIVISTADELSKNTITHVYDVRDFLRGPNRDAASEKLQRLVTNTVSPDGWRDNGGTVGAMRELEGMLIITQSERNHIQIKKLLEQLRER